MRRSRMGSRRLPKAQLVWIAAIAATAVVLSIALTYAAGRQPERTPLGTTPEPIPAGTILEKHTVSWSGRNGVEVACFVSVRSESGLVRSVQISPAEYARLQKGSVIRTRPNAAAGRNTSRDELGTGVR